jgi:hypothetical protein
VTGNNTNAKGIGVQGTGKKFGVYSNGNLGVASGSYVAATGGDSETGELWAMLELDRAIVGDVIVREAADNPTECPGVGHAKPGSLCLYYDVKSNVTYNAQNGDWTRDFLLIWTIDGSPASVSANYTVTAR